jgi:hypothetical protein
MGNTGKFSASGRRSDIHELNETPSASEGRIEFDELGNAVWVPYGVPGSEEVMARLLNENRLSLDEADPWDTSRIRANPNGLSRGYDPYDSGMLVKKTWKKKKDLRALSTWIGQQNGRKGR